MQSVCRSTTTWSRIGYVGVNNHTILTSRSFRFIRTQRTPDNESVRVWVAPEPIISQLWRIISMPFWSWKLCRPAHRERLLLLHLQLDHNFRLLKSSKFPTIHYHMSNTFWINQRPHIHSQKYLLQKKKLISSWQEAERWNVLVNDGVQTD
jgi:hypothetical protein